jgi:hypothetical protein
MYTFGVILVGAGDPTSALKDLLKMLYQDEARDGKRVSRYLLPRF